MKQIVARTLLFSLLVSILGQLGCSTYRELSEEASPFTQQVDTMELSIKHHCGSSDSHHGNENTQCADHCHHHGHCHCPFLPLLSSYSYIQHVKQISYPNTDLLPPSSHILGVFRPPIV